MKKPNHSFAVNVDMNPENHMWDRKSQQGLRTQRPEMVRTSLYHSERNSEKIIYWSKHFLQEDE